jgi:hypothetical protein
MSMTPKRPKSLKWIGEQYPDGRPAQYLDFLRPEDIDEDKTAELTQEQLAIIRQHPDLYREVHEPESRKPKARSDSNKRGVQPRTALAADARPPQSVSHTDDPHATEPEPAADDADTAAKPATESEDS